MRVLFDNGTPRGIARELVGHTVKEAREQGWDRMRNGELLDAAEAAGFEVLLTTDKGIRYSTISLLERSRSLRSAERGGSSFDRC